MKYQDIAESYCNWYYVGNKRSIIPWIFRHLEGMEISSAIDLFGGSGIISHTFLSLGIETWYNEFLRSIYTMTDAILSNHQLITQEEIQSLFQPIDTHELCQQYLTPYFDQSERELLDIILTNINNIEDVYKQAKFLYLLSQATLKKQGKGVFQDNTMNRRRKDNNVQSSWHGSIQAYLEEARKDLNQYFKTYDNYPGDILQTTNYTIREISEEMIGKIDLIYADPPFNTTNTANFGNYVHNYHVLEFFYNYPEIEVDKRKGNTKLKKFKEDDERLVNNKFWIRPEYMEDSFDHLAGLSEGKILVLSYRSSELMTQSNLQNILSRYFDNVELRQRSHIYENGGTATYDDLLYICS